MKLDDVDRYVEHYAKQGIETDAAEIEKLRAESKRGQQLLAEQPVLVGDIWIETQPRQRVFRIVVVNTLYVIATPAFPQPSWVLDTTWRVEDFFRCFRPYTPGEGAQTAP